MWSIREILQWIGDTIQMIFNLIIIAVSFLVIWFVAFIAVASAIYVVNDRSVYSTPGGGAIVIVVSFILSAMAFAVLWTLIFRRQSV